MGKKEGQTEQAKDRGDGYGDGSTQGRALQGRTGRWSRSWAYVSGRIRRYYLRIRLGDRVKVELLPFDLDRGCIVYRYKRR